MVGMQGVRERPEVWGAAVLCGAADAPKPPPTSQPPNPEETACLFIPPEWHRLTNHVLSDPAVIYGHPGSPGGRAGVIFSSLSHCPGASGTGSSQDQPDDLHGGQCEGRAVE